MPLLRLTVFLLGAGLVIATLRSALRVFVLPRGVQDRLIRYVFQITRALIQLAMRRARTFADRDRIMAFYAPVALLVALPVWLIMVSLGYDLMYWGVGYGSFRQSYILSGSSLLTLGFAQGGTLLDTLLVFSEATIGLMLVALLIAYLPTMYSAFSRRELEVTLLEVRAGSPPSAIEMLLRYHRIGGLDRLAEAWDTWERWFADVEESHTTLAALVFFRSPQLEHSWTTAAGAVLDTTSLSLSALDAPFDAETALCIRAGFLVLRRIAAFFDLPFNPDPHFPADPISITRAEFDAACEELTSAGLPLKPDRDQAWQDFAGWRVNYDAVLLHLCSLVMAPTAPWSSDRAPEFELSPPWRRRRQP